MSDCDNWLKTFYEKKREKNPEIAQQVMAQLELKLPELKKNEDYDFQKACATAKYEISSYLANLSLEVEEKISKEGKSK